jgi:hypothetical protein
MTTGRNAFSLVEVIPGATRPSSVSRARCRRTDVPGCGRDGEAEQATSTLAAPGLVRGTVLPEGTDGVLVALDGGASISARRAAGCLLRPEPGDTVLLHLPEPGKAYVLCVLEKAGQVAVFDAPGELRIKAGGSLDLTAPEVRLRGRAGRIDFLGLDLLVGTLTAKAGRIAAVAASLDSHLGDLTQHIRLAVRQVETEIVRAGGIRQFIRERFLVRADRASILAEDEVTVDAKKIHLG